jgi:diphthamide synthase (EF-2-diphthine--ammonia ligase)
MVAQRPECALMFSGGRDSTLAAVALHREARFVHLLSFDSGLGYHGHLRELRVQELQGIFSFEQFTHQTIIIRGLVRRICLAPIADDVLSDGCQCLLLGEFTSMLAAALVYCRRRGVTRLACGAAAYQEHCAEQRPEVLDCFERLCRRYGVEFVLPVRPFATQDAVKQALDQAGVSTKSLEAITLLADLGEPPVDVALRYVARKLPIVEEHIGGAIQVSR